MNEYNNEKYLVFNDQSLVVMNLEHETIEMMKQKFENKQVSEAPIVYSISSADAIEKSNKTSFVFIIRIKIKDIDVSRSYKACPTEICQRKVVKAGKSLFPCDKCGKNYTMYSVHALLKVRLNDLFNFFFNIL